MTVKHDITWRKPKRGPDWRGYVTLCGLNAWKARDHGPFLRCRRCKRVRRAQRRWMKR